jgi:serine/threonine protein kinase
LSRSTYFILTGGITGCLIYELIFARTPFQADYHTKVFQNIVSSAKTITFPSSADPQHRAIVMKLLNPNPAFRLGYQENGVLMITMS